MRWIFRAAATLITLAVVAVIALFLIPTDRIARLAEAEFEKNTGRILALSGEVSPQIFPRLGVVLNEVTISNADWAGSEPMLEADRLEVGVTLAALMGGDINVEAFSVDGPVIRLMRDSNGNANWDFIADLGGAEDDDTGESPNISLPKGEITNATLVYIDKQSGTSETLTQVDAQIGLPDLGGTATLALSARRNGQPFALDAVLNGVQPLLDGEVRGVVAAFQTGGTSAKFDGQAGLEPLQAKGKLTADVADQKALFALIDATPPVIPPGLGQRTQVTGDLTLTADNQVFLRGATLQLDQNQFRGDLDVKLGDTPYVTARMVGDRIDFSAMSTDTSEGDGAANAGAGGWSDAPIDVSGLNAVNGEFSLRANAIDLGSLQLAATDLSGTIENSRMVLDFSELGVFDGKVSGRFVVNGRGGLSVRGDMRASGVAMQQVLNDFAGYDRLVADGAMRLQFLGVGNTMNALMNSLDGEGSMDVGAGEILGLDIAGMIKNLDTSFRGEGSKTVFNDMTASFAIADGILSNNDLNFVAPLLTAKGQGTLDLGGQTVKYYVDPVALADQLKSGIRVPVIVEGPWSDIKFRPDLKALIDTELEEQKEKLKAAAKAKEEELRAKAEAKQAELRAAADAKEAELKAQAAQKLQDELNVERAEGESAEDALKQGLENKVKEGLGRLLGGN